MERKDKSISSNAECIIERLSSTTLTCTQEEIARDIAKAAEGARIASLASGRPQLTGGVNNPSSTNMQLSRHARRIYCGGLPVRMGVDARACVDIMWTFCFVMCVK